ncbi:50S ribosomal protein L2 [Candidatus Wolfebacteria bacterium]|nr:50S ribosomal protein L2 [Candidatus Wolfebacteria bacterium]
MPITNLKKYNPTTPSRRQMTGIEYGKFLTEIEPIKKFLVRLPKRSGRNSQGRITMRHQGGGNKKLYRMIDFKQNKFGIPARIEAIEYDPYRTAFLARVIYKDGERSYILASKEMKVGDEIISSENAPLKEGNRLALKNVPVGYFVYNIELSPKKGGQLARSAGSYAKILAQDGKYTHLKMSSGETRRVFAEGFASIGQVSNPEHILTNIGKAGRTRHWGIRPTVRGTAMNPRDHPYGGGEGRQRRGTKRPKTKWGKVTGGRKTRNKKKYSNKMILERRKK